MQSTTLQVLGLVQLTLGIISFIGVLVILIVLLTRGEGTEYSIVTFFVLLICCVPVGEELVSKLHITQILNQELLSWMAHFESEHILNSCWQNAQGSSSLHDSFTTILSFPH